MKRVSEAGLDFIKRWEGVELKPYQDVAGYWTVGVGHLMTRSELSSGKIVLGHDKIRWRDGLTEEQAERLLQTDLFHVESAIDATARTLTQSQFDALASLIFNIGVGAFHGSTLRRKILAGEMDQVPEQMLRWNRAGGRKVRGLTLRRQAEAELWQS